MPPFRGSDERLEAEIHAVDRIIEVRLRRYAREMAQLERERRELTVERSRRRVGAAGSVRVAQQGRATAAPASD